MSWASYIRRCRSGGVWEAYDIIGGLNYAVLIRDLGVQLGSREDRAGSVEGLRLFFGVGTLHPKVSLLVEMLKRIVKLGEWSECVRVWRRSDRRMMMKLRGGTAGFEIEAGRWRGVAREERVCKLCDSGEVEDVGHWLMRCEAQRVPLIGGLNGTAHCQYPRSCCIPAVWCMHKLYQLLEIWLTLFIIIIICMCV